jgi:hypothetical protein
MAALLVLAQAVDAPVPEVSAPPNAPHTALTLMQRAQMQAERERLLESTPPLKPAIVTFAVPVGGIIAAMFVALGALMTASDCLPGRCDLGPAIPYWLGWLAICAVAAIPGAIWMGVRLRDYGLATQKASELQHALEMDAPAIDGESADP